MNEPDKPGLAAGLLVVAPVLGAAQALALPYVLRIGEHPLGWLSAIAAAAVVTTTLAAASERRTPLVGTAWAMLLAWPLAFPWYMNRTGRLGTGLAGTLLLCGALAWAGWQVQQARAGVAELEQKMLQLLQSSGEEISTQASSEDFLTPPSSEEKLSEAERQRIVRQRIEAMLDAE